MYLEMFSQFVDRQHPSLSKPIVAGLQVIGVDDVGYAFGTEWLLFVSRTCCATGLYAKFVQAFGNFGIRVVFKQLIYEFDSFGRRLNLLGVAFGVVHSKCFGSASFEPHMDLRLLGLA